MQFRPRPSSEGTRRRGDHPGRWHDVSGGRTTERTTPRNWVEVGSASPLSGFDASNPMRVGANHHPRDACTDETKESRLVPPPGTIGARRKSRIGTGSHCHLFPRSIRATGHHLVQATPIGRTTRGRRTKRDRPRRLKPPDTAGNSGSGRPGSGRVGPKTCRVKAAAEREKRRENGFLQ